MMHRKKENYWKGVKLILFAPVTIMLLQAFAQPEVLSEKIGEIVPSIVQKDSSEIWLDNWTIENLSKVNGGIQLAEIEIKPPPESSKLELPKYDKTRDGHPIPTSNIMTVLINKDSKILASNIAVTKDEVLAGVKKFLDGNPPFDAIKNGPESVEKNLPLIGNAKITKGVIVLRYDVKTDKDYINKLLQSIGKLYLEKREQVAKERFSQNYFSLPTDKREVVDQLVPVRVSIMEPKNTNTSQIKPPPPPPPNIIELTLKEDGKVLFGKEEYSIAEIEQKIIESKKERTEMYKKWNMDPELVTSVKIEVGVTDTQVNALKEALRRAKAMHVNYSTDYKELSTSERTEEVKPPPPPPPMFWVGLSKNKILLNNKEISITELEKRAKSFMENVKNDYSVRVSADSDVSKEEFETITNALKKSNIPESKILCIVNDASNE